MAPPNPRPLSKHLIQPMSGQLAHLYLERSGMSAKTWPKLRARPFTKKAALVSKVVAEMHIPIILVSTLKRKHDLSVKVLSPLTYLIMGWAGTDSFRCSLVTSL